MSHKLTHNVPPSSQCLPACHAGRCCLPNPSASHPFLTLFPVIPFLSRPFPIFLSSRSCPASHHLFITLQHSLGRVTVLIGVQDRIFLGRGSILGAILQRITLVQILCDTVKGMRHKSPPFPSSVFYLGLFAAEWQHWYTRDVTFIAPPRCPLEPCQTREQTRNWSVPKYSGKESKQYICWVDKRSEMPWCLWLFGEARFRYTAGGGILSHLGQSKLWLNVGCFGLLLYEKSLIIS